MNHLTTAKETDAFDQIEALLKQWTDARSNEEKELKPFSQNKIKEFYYIAYQLYRDQQYKKASHFFRLLTLVDPFEAKYWKGLGASYQMLKEYDQAIHCYVCVHQLSQKQPDPYIYVHAADCYFALGQKEQGLKALKGAKAAAEEQNNTKVLNHVALMYQVWCNNKN